MNVYTALSTNPLAKLSDFPWGGQIVTMVSLTSSIGSLVDPDITCGQLLDMILDLPDQQRKLILELTVVGVSHQERTEHIKGRVAVILAGSITLAAVVIVGVYVAATAHRGGTVDNVIFQEFFKFLGDLFINLSSSL